MESLTHIRRCHVCNAVTQREDGEVDRCDHCHKALAQFYFFDDRRVLPLSDNKKSSEKSESYRPIRGLTAYWDPLF